MRIYVYAPWGWGEMDDGPGKVVGFDVRTVRGGLAAMGGQREPLEGTRSGERDRHPERMEKEQKPTLNHPASFREGMYVRVARGRVRSSSRYYYPHWAGHPPGRPNGYPI
jgi:hypothetical protein